MTMMTTAMTMMGGYVSNGNNAAAAASNNNNSSHRFFFAFHFHPAVLLFNKQMKKKKKKKMLFTWFMIVGLLSLTLFQNRPEKMQQEIMENGYTIDNTILKTSAHNNATAASTVATLNSNDNAIIDYDTSTFPTHIQGYIRQMIDKNLTKSARHMLKLWHHKEILSKLDSAFTYKVETMSGGGVRIQGDYSYLHIWKSGGTTMTQQVHGVETSINKLKSHPNNKFVTFVRDPIDHFLSGWSECQLRWNKNNVPRARERGKLFDSDPTIYNSFIQQYLNGTKHWSQSGHVSCFVHSFAQINFMLLSSNKDRLIHPQIHIVGDISEIRGVLSLVNFTYNETKVGRNATKNPFKRNYFRSRRDQLNQQTLVGLCDFVALDYYLLDYELPRECRYDIPSSYNSTNSLLHILNMTRKSIKKEIE